MEISFHSIIRIPFDKNDEICIQNLFKNIVRDLSIQSRRNYSGHNLEKFFRGSRHDLEIIFPRSLRNSKETFRGWWQNLKEIIRELRHKSKRNSRHNLKRKTFRNFWHDLEEIFRRNCSRLAIEFRRISRRGGALATQFTSSSGLAAESRLENHRTWSWPSEDSENFQKREFLFKEMKFSWKMKIRQIDRTCWQTFAAQCSRRYNGGGASPVTMVKYHCSNVYHGERRSVYTRSLRVDFANDASNRPVVDVASPDAANS